MSSTNSDYYFLRGGGEMGELIRAKDWSKTPLGDPANWPPSLCTMVAVMLDNPSGMYIAWGPEYTQLYNDGYRPILGTTKHPQALGISTRETFSEIWHIIEARFDGVMQGKADRNGFQEICNFDFSCSPIRKENGEIGGVLVTAIEMTEKKSITDEVEAGEHKLRTLVENVPFPIAVYGGEDMTIELANQSIIDTWGKGNHVIGKSFKEVMPELDHQLVFEQIQQVFKTGTSFHTQNTPLDLVIAGKPKTFYFNYSLTPLYDAVGSIYGVLNTGIDLTDLNTAKQQIEESKRLYETITNNTPDLIYVFDLNYRFIYANEALLKMWGRTWEDAIGKGLLEIGYEPWHAEMHEREIDQVIATKNPVRGNVSFQHATLGNRIYDYIFAPITDQDGKVVSIAGTTRDITQLVEATKQIEAADKRFRNTVQQAPVGITILRGPQYIVEMANDTYLQLVDRKENEFVGQPLFDVLPEVEATVHPLLDSVRNSGVPYHGNEVPVPINRFGKTETNYFDFLYHPLKEEDGEISGVIVTVTEVSDKVEARMKTEQNEERLKILVEASELGTWELNLKTMEPHYSKRYLEIVGGYKDEISLTHEQLLRHLHPDDRETREKAFKEAMLTGYLQFEARLIWNDNSIHWMEGKGKVFYDAAQQPKKMIGTIRDITTDKKHQEELQESEQRFRNLIMESPVPKAILRGEEHIVEMANEVLLKDIWRKNSDEVMGKKVLEIFPELKKQKYARLLHEVYATGIKYTEKESFISLQGNDGLKYYYIDFEYAPVFSGDHKVSGIKITTIDVTEKVEARKQIEASEKRFRSLAESLPQLVWETDAKGNSLFASGRWEEYSGIIPHGEAEWRAVIHPDDYDDNARLWAHSLATGELYRCDVRLKSKTGEYRWHAVIGEPVYDNENKIIKWVGAFTDNQTEKTFTQELEKQVAERTKELGDTNIELGKMNKELQTFAYISSHDLQEPLRKIQTFTSQILEKESRNLSDKGKDLFHRMANAASRMQTLIDDLLTFSRTNTPERKFEKADLGKIVEEVKEDLKEELLKKHAIIDSEGLGTATIIPVQFRQLLFNLINNSLKFSNPARAPHIEIKTERATGAAFNHLKLKAEANYCHISVADNGIGFEQQYNEKIFEVFQRLHGKNEFEGTGIGLSIVKRIVENHDGFITAKGELNKGARFDIYIPA